MLGVGAGVTFGEDDFCVWEEHSDSVHPPTMRTCALHTHRNRIGAIP